MLHDNFIKKYVSKHLKAHICPFTNGQICKKDKYFDDRQIICHFVNFLDLFLDLIACVSLLESINVNLIDGIHRTGVHVRNITLEINTMISSYLKTVE